MELITSLNGRQQSVPIREGKNIPVDVKLKDASSKLDVDIVVKVFFLSEEMANKFVNYISEAKCISMSDKLSMVNFFSMLFPNTLYPAGLFIRFPDLKVPFCFRITSNLIPQWVLKVNTMDQLWFDTLANFIKQGNFNSTVTAILFNAEQPSTDNFNFDGTNLRIPLCDFSEWSKLLDIFILKDKDAMFNKVALSRSLSKLVFDFISKSAPPSEVEVYSEKYFVFTDLDFIQRETFIFDSNKNCVTDEDLEKVILYQLEK